MADNKGTFNCKYCGLSKDKLYCCQDCFHILFNKWCEMDDMRARQIRIESMFQGIVDSLEELKKEFNKIRGVKKVNTMLCFEDYP